MATLFIIHKWIFSGQTDNGSLRYTCEHCNHVIEKDSVNSFLDYVFGTNIDELKCEKNKS